MGYAMGKVGLEGSGMRTGALMLAVGNQRVPTLAEVPLWSGDTGGQVRVRPAEGSGPSWHGRYDSLHSQAGHRQSRGPQGSEPCHMQRSPCWFRLGLAVSTVRVIPEGRNPTCGIWGMKQDSAQM